VLDQTAIIPHTESLIRFAEVHLNLAADEFQIGIESAALGRFKAFQHACLTGSDHFFRHRGRDFLVRDGFPDHGLTAVAPFTATVGLGRFDDLAAAQRTGGDSFFCGWHRLAHGSDIARLALPVQGQLGIKDVIVDMDGMSIQGPAMLQQLAGQLVRDWHAIDVLP
jgi:hypothetical protein